MGCHMVCSRVSKELNLYGINYSYDTIITQYCIKSMVTIMHYYGNSYGCSISCMGLTPVFGITIYDIVIITVLTKVHQLLQIKES